MNEESEREMKALYEKAVHLDYQGTGNHFLEDVIERSTQLLLKLDLAIGNEQELSDIAQVYWIKARSLNNLNRYAEAYTMYLESLEIIKRCSKDFNLIELKSLYGLAWTTARLIRYEQSLDFCDQFITIAIKLRCLMTFKDIYTVRGVCHKELGNSLRAQKDFYLTNSDLIRQFESIGEEFDFNL